VALFLFFYEAKAQTLTVRDVKISVKAESAASAREQALDQAHRLAFQKLLQENFPEHPFPVPPHEVLNTMVNDFSIEREKSTPTSYTASLTFQFDEPQVMAWIQQPQQNGEKKLAGRGESQPAGKGTPIKILASYNTHREWLYLKKTLEKCVGVRNFSIFSLSPKNAKFEIYYHGALDQLEQALLQKNILLSQQKEYWMVALNK